MKRKVCFYVLLGLSLWLRVLGPTLGGILLALWLLEAARG